MFDLITPRTPNSTKFNPLMPGGNNQALKG